MACTYSFGGNLLDCKESAGGVKEIYIIDRAFVTAYTVNVTTKVIDTITLSGVNKFKTYQLRRQVASMNTTVTTSDTAGTTFYSTDVTFTIPKMSAAKRLELLALAVGNMAVIVRDNNNTYWALGLENPVTLTAGSAGTGTNFGDANGYTYTLQDLGFTAPSEINRSILSDIIDSNISLPLPV